MKYWGVAVYSWHYVIIIVVLMLLLIFPLMTITYRLKVCL